MVLPESVRRIVESSAAQFQAHVIEIVFRGHYRKPVIEVFIDAPGPVTTELCAAVSRTISDELDVKKIVAAEYRLEVSSPGIERPLRYLWQFPKHAGRRFRMKVESSEGTEVLEGTLTAVEGEQLVLRLASGSDVRLPFAGVKEAKAILPW